MPRSFMYPRSTDAKVREKGLVGLSSDMGVALSGLEVRVGGFFTPEG
jgi:hypothetical protein